MVVTLSSAQRHTRKLAPLEPAFLLGRNRDDDFTHAAYHGMVKSIVHPKLARRGHNMRKFIFCIVVLLAPTLEALTQDNRAYEVLFFIGHRQDTLGPFTFIQNHHLGFKIGDGVELSPPHKLRFRKHVRIESDECVARYVPQSDEVRLWKRTTQLSNGTLVPIVKVVDGRKPRSDPGRTRYFVLFL